MGNGISCQRAISETSRFMTLAVYVIAAQFSYADDTYPIHKIPVEHFSEINPPARGFHLELQIQSPKVQSQNEWVDPERKPVICRSFVSKTSLAEGELRKLNRHETPGGHLGWPNRCGFMFPSEAIPYHVTELLCEADVHPQSISLARLCVDGL